MSGVELKRKLVRLGTLEKGNVCYSRFRYDKFRFRHEWQVLGKDSRYVHLYDFVFGVEYWLPKGKTVYTDCLSFPEGMSIKELKGVDSSVVAPNIGGVKNA